MKEDIRPIDEVYKAMMKGDIYLVNDFEEIAVKIPFGSDRYFAKAKGGREYEINPAGSVVYGAMGDGKLMTAEEYASY